MNILIGVEDPESSANVSESICCERFVDAIHLLGSSSQLVRKDDIHHG
jgi:hypothetical protein